MTRRVFGYITLLTFFLAACGQGDDQDSSAEADSGPWAVVDANDSITSDGASLLEVADSSLGVDANLGDTGQSAWDATGDGAGEVSASDGTEPTPDASATQSWGGGVLLYELASDFLNIAGAGARFTEAASGPGTVDDAAEQWGPCAASVSDPDAPEVVEVGFDAGVITTMGTTSEVLLSPQNEGANGVGYSSNLDDDLETLLTPGGALITVYGAGGADIDSFEIVVQVPEPVTLSSPETGLFKSSSASSDLTVNWNAGTGEAILVTATPLDDAFQTAPGVGLICGAEQDTGSLIIPAQAMAAMKSSGVNRVALAVTRLRFGTALVGEKLVTATVTRSSGGPLDLN